MIQSRLPPLRLPLQASKWYTSQGLAKSSAAPLCSAGINVVQTIINNPFENGLYNLFLVIWGMVCYCVTHITVDGRNPAAVLKRLITMKHRKWWEDNGRNHNWCRIFSTVLRIHLSQTILTRCKMKKNENIMAGDGKWWYIMACNGKLW